MLLFHAQIAEGDLDELQRGEEDMNGQPLAYEHESLAGADAIMAAGAGAGVTAGALSAGGGGVATQTQRVVSEQDKVGRNDPCWCGSGKKFKKCHGA
jgi:preprotein translocase subunit SecA